MREPVTIEIEDYLRLLRADDELQRLKADMRFREEQLMDLRVPRYHETVLFKTADGLSALAVQKVDCNIIHRPIIRSMGSVGAVDVEQIDRRTYAFECFVHGKRTSVRVYKEVL